MALSGSAARRYAEALIEVASEEGDVPAHRASLERLRDALGADLLRALRDPGVPLARRRAALAKAAEGEPRAVRALLDLLIERDRIMLLPDIARACGEIVDRRAGVVKARITTPIELAARDREALVRRLEQASGKTVRATFLVDTSLIGGAKVQIGDRLVDISLQSQLSALARQLSGSS